MPAGEQFRRYYPGLIPMEERLWRTWLKEHETDFEAFEYNVRVGEGIRIAPRALDADPVLQEKISRQFQEATQKKIDVVGRRGGEVWIFEVEERPGTRALGQLISYQTLLPRTRLVEGPIVLALVARRIGGDNLIVFEDAGVVVWRVNLED